MELIMKKDWEKPELIVIVKTELEEDVLAACKATAAACDEKITGPRLGSS